MRRNLATLMMTLLVVMSIACSDSGGEMSDTSPVGPSMERAVIDLRALIIGEVQHDDDSDIRITLKETNGVAARVNYLKLTCNDRTVIQWGAGNITAERGSSRIEANGEMVIVRHYFCRTSGRPFRIEADLTDDNGHALNVNSAPSHPGWPGG